MKPYHFASEREDVRIRVVAESDEAAWKELDKTLDKIFTDHGVLVTSRMLRLLPLGRGTEERS